MNGKSALIAAMAMAFLIPSPPRPLAAECTGRLVVSETVMTGKVCLPETIERVVVLDPFYNLVMGLELGLPIVGAASAGLAAAGGIEGAGAVVDIGQAEEPDLETITRLKPDLILGDAYLRGRNIEILSKIAPTALIATADWKAYYRTIADVSGHRPIADARLADYEARAKALSARVGGKTLSFVRILPGGFQVYVDGPSAYAPFRVLADAGVGRTAYERVTEDTVLKRSDWEGLIALQGDVLFYVIGGSGGDPAFGGLEAETLGNPLWSLLPAVRNGKAHRVDARTWMGFGGIASAHKVLDDVERYLAAAP